MTFQRIRNLREDNDLTQTQIAEILHIKQTTYSKYELGKVNIPNDALIRLAKFYNTSVDYLMDLTDEIKPYSRSKKR